MSAPVSFTVALTNRMDAAALALDFEEARRLRDRISLMRDGATADEAAEVGGSGLIASGRALSDWDEAAACRAAARVEAASEATFLTSGRCRG